MRKVLDSIWFSGQKGTYGAILTEDEFKQVAYTGVVAGDRQDWDEKFLLDWGSKLTKEQAIGFFGNQVNEETYRK